MAAATTLYLVRHAATAANLARPPRLQGRGQDPPLAPEGLAQATSLRQVLAGTDLRACWCSPLRRAVQTAAEVAAPHGLDPQPLEALTECDVGRWEGLSWDEVRHAWPADYARFQADPWSHGYPGGESMRQVHERAAPILDGLLDRHDGLAVLVVSHHVVLRVYLAILLGLPPARVRQVGLANASVSVVVRHGGATRVQAVSEVGHLAVQ